MKEVSFKSLFKLGLISAYPWLLLVFFGFLVIPIKATYIRELIAFGLLIVIVNSLLWMIFRIDLDTFNSSGNNTILSNGQYQTIGSPSENQGKIPFLYA